MAVYYNDADPAACAWLRELIAAKLLPDGDVDERSILEVEPADLRGFMQCHFFAGIGGWPYALRLAGVAEDLSVWTGSPPCQPFSQAGQRKGQDDDRHLAPAFLRLVAECRPELVFGEQVASAAVLGPVGSAARTAAEDPAGWAWFDALAADLEAASYAVAAADLPAAGIGAPHIRQRLFFGAVTWSRAGWATASARDHKDGSERRTVPINALLGRQVWLAGWPTAMAGSPATAAYNAAGNTDASRRTVKLVDWSKAPTPPEPMRRTASGEIRTGSSAAMAAGGPLSPEHSRWLMGYPAAWGSCGATAMRSCRRSRRSS
jgi:site-specific DNA-cytosine methylase